MSSNSCVSSRSEGVGVRQVGLSRDVVGVHHLLAHLVLNPKVKE